MKVRPKKSLGQHFLKNDAISARIAGSLTGHGGYKQILEIGPGMGALTRHLLELESFSLVVVELDRESVPYLKENFPELKDRIIERDFLKLPLDELFTDKFAITGNFPFNISSQILFKTLEHRNQVSELVGMFQREVAQRMASKPGTRNTGILSVFVQAYYDVEYLFTVDEHEFIPPPKVKSGVIRLKRNATENLDCDEVVFFKVVKTAFNQRRKTMRNSLKALSDGKVDLSGEIFSKRPEQLSVEEFVKMTRMFSN
ncbi:MAG: 16S rRNA (adenine(1518)-N(6)/adenine(1519)-N(6))-dimethyltransferase RsmA [Flavobacteriales bacterium]|nr:16S rRNA (adenine(1518)-N(6)/adenine(1519)-N(6))-dimethyltransferase RsmA [Flavobacteriales bacterium]